MKNGRLVENVEFGSDEPVSTGQKQLWEELEVMTSHNMGPLTAKDACMRLA